MQENIFKKENNLSSVPDLVINNDQSLRSECNKKKMIKIREPNTDIVTNDLKSTDPFGKLYNIEIVLYKVGDNLDFKI